METVQAQITEESSPVFRGHTRDVVADMLPRIRIRGKPMHQQLKRVLKRVRALPDASQWEVAEVLLASIDQQSPDVHLSPRKIAEAERDAANHGRFATDEEVEKAFRRMAHKGRLGVWELQP
jgi:hypothetical protein